MSKSIRLAAVLALIASLFAATFSASAQEQEEQDDFVYHEIATDEFYEVWERTDRPVSELAVSRTWIWGPGGFTGLLTEEYAEAEDGERQVQYFDKSRMEMPSEGAADTEDTDSPWFITQGLLATELLTGNLQLGDETFEQHQPSNRSVAGDPDDDNAPTYAVMGEHMQDEDPQTGDVIVDFMDRNGNVTTDERFADYDVTNAEYDDVTDHNIASVFWDFMNSETTVYEDGQYVEDDLFLNPYYAVGRPLTEAYWTWVQVDGVEQDVLVQCFERRCLTYTPGNPEGWKVESGNIGQHYYNWRYEQIDRDAPTAGTFTYDGEEMANIGIGDEIVLTAHVTSHGDDAEGAPVYFQVIGGDEDAVSLDPQRARTDADGNAEVTVTGESEGTAEVQAFVDLNDNGTYDFEIDLGLGVVEVTVDEADDEQVPETGSFTFDGESEAEVEVDSNISLTAEVEDDEGNPVEGAEVYFWIFEEAESVISIDPFDTLTDDEGMAEVTVTGLAEGTADVHAFADRNDNGVFDDGTDVDLGIVEVTVVDDGDA